MIWIYIALAVTFVLGFVIAGMVDSDWVALLGYVLVAGSLIGILVTLLVDDSRERNELVTQLNATEITSFVDVDELQGRGVFVTSDGTVYVWKDGKLTVK